MQPRYFNLSILFQILIHCPFLIADVIFYLQSMIGHCLGAAGGLEAIATIKAITTGWVHPSINQFVSNSTVNLATILLESVCH
jgi:hypothetical protein